MARIRALSIRNFRGIKSLTWFPSPGMNCLIGPGDSGKSTILDAIDFCLGARRTVQFTDADFHGLDVTQPIAIEVTIGELDSALKSLETYGTFLRGFDATNQSIDDEPEVKAETVLTIALTVASDLEPKWALFSERGSAHEQSRNLSWGDRIRVAPARIGALADYHLGWRRGSVLNRVSEERADASAALVSAAREARASFGEKAKDQLGETLGIVAETAKELGIPIGEDVKAILDAHSVSFSGGAISLHDERGVPLSGLGTGSTRLLIGGLQRKAAEHSSIILIDELEHGLEPHRIIRLLGSLGAKETKPPMQVLVTTHSPVALRELSGSQLFVVRCVAERHEVRAVGVTDDIQSTIRLFPDAFLAPKVLVCEGASEVGLIRGLDLFRIANGCQAITAQGVALVDSGGGGPDRPYARAAAFQALGYSVAVLRDDDLRPSAEVEVEFVKSGGKVFSWHDGWALEDSLFLSLSSAAVEKLLDRAVELHGETAVSENIKSASQNSKTLAYIRLDAISGEISLECRKILGKAARAKRSGWFKQVTWMQEVACDIVGPSLENSAPKFKAIIDSIFAWAADAGE